jgi:hypothetical protein
MTLNVFFLYTYSSRRWMFQIHSFWVDYITLKLFFRSLSFIKLSQMCLRWIDNFATCSILAAIKAENCYTFITCSSFQGRNGGLRDSKELQSPPKSLLLYKSATFLNSLIKTKKKHHVCKTELAFVETVQRLFNNRSLREKKVFISIKTLNICVITFIYFSSFVIILPVIPIFLSSFFPSWFRM